MVKTKLLKSTIALTALSSLLLVGCGSASASKTDKADEETQAPAASENTDSVSTEQSPAAAGVFGEAFANGQVENNGSSFVRVGDKVYYRVMAPENVQKGTLGGWLDESAGEASSSIMSYDLKTGEATNVASVQGVDELYAVPEGLVVSSINYKETLLCPMDGSEPRSYLDGYPVAVSDNGRMIATHKYVDGESNYNNLYVDGNEVAKLTDEEDWRYSFKSSGNNIFALKEHYNTVDDIQKPYLYSYDENGNCTEYGQVQLAADDEYLTQAYGLSQVLQDGDDVYLLFTYYQGSGGYYAGYEIHKLTVGKADSLTLVKASIPDKEASSEEEGILNDSGVQSMYLDDSKNIATAMNEVGTVGTESSTDDNSSLVFYDKPDHSVQIKDSYFSTTDSNNQFLNSGAAFGDDVFLIVADTVSDPEQSIGWRDGYSIQQIRFVHINKKDGKEDVLETLKL